MIAELPFAVSPYGSEERFVGGQRAINMMLRPAGQGARAQSFWRHTPGLKRRIAATGSSACRGMWTASNGRVFQVIGVSLVEIFAGMTNLVRGILSSGSGPVQMTDNGSQMLIVDGVGGYLFKFAPNTLATITSANFPAGATHCAFIDGYFVANEPATIFFRRSDLYDGETWDAEQASAEGSPDEVNSIAVASREVWVGGERSVEVFYNSGDVDQVFQRVSNAVIGVGVAAKYSLVPIRGRVMWLSNAGAVYISQGIQAQRISPPGIEEAIGQTDVSGAFAWVYESEGSAFYVLTIPVQERTYVYDLDANEWHERAWMNPETGELSRWRATFGTYGHGRNLTGDSSTECVYEIDNNQYFDDKPDSGSIWIKRRVDTPDNQAKGRTQTIYRSFEVECTSGQGTVTGQGVAPLLMVSYSDDGGATWSHSRHIPIGALGARGTRARDLMFGAARMRRWRIEQTDPVPAAWLRLWADIDGGRF